MTATPARLSAPTTAARKLLEQQTADPRRFIGLNLDRIWRECGEPAGKAPVDWLRLARPALTALSTYRKRLLEAIGDPIRAYVHRDDFWIVTRRTLETSVSLFGTSAGFELGDHLVDEEAAALFAAYLDGRGFARDDTTSGREQRRAFAKKAEGLPPFTCPEPIAPRPQPTPKPVVEPVSA